MRVPKPLSTLAATGYGDVAPGGSMSPPRPKHTPDVATRDCCIKA